jgi:cell division protease FtsH
LVDRPDKPGREAILRVHTPGVKLAEDVDLERLAARTPGFAGADLENLVNEAALMAARAGAKEIDLELLEKAKDKIMMGAERRSMIISEKEKKITAYHEAGHALVAWLLEDTDPIHKVTIIPRGRALGLTMQLPTDDKYTHSKSYLEHTICILYGGRIAEKIIFNEITTGAGNDIERASAMARKMVCEWGMSESLGALTYGKKEEQIFLGREIGQVRDFSEDTARKIDMAVKEIIDQAMDTVTRMLEEHRDILSRMAEDLLEKETIVLSDLENIIEELRPGQYSERIAARRAGAAVAGSQQAPPASGAGAATSAKPQAETVPGPAAQAEPLAAEEEQPTADDAEPQADEGAAASESEQKPNDTPQ